LYAGVQRNISRIIAVLDKKYRLSKICLEGGYGVPGTPLIAGISNREIRNEIADSMLESGRLSGAEYYSILNDRISLLNGIENKELHQSNILRLDEVISEKSFFEQTLKQLDKDIDYFKSTYISEKNRRFTELVEAYHNGAIQANKYYVRLLKYARRINKHPEAYNPVYRIDLRNYPNIIEYIETSSIGKHISQKLVSQQLIKFSSVMKSKADYYTYNSLLEDTNNYEYLERLDGAFKLLYSRYNFERCRSCIYAA
jgi:hypothetical protein